MKQMSKVNQKKFAQIAVELAKDGIKEVNIALDAELSLLVTLTPYSSVKVTPKQEEL